MIRTQHGLPPSGRSTLTEYCCLAVEAVGDVDGAGAAVLGGVAAACTASAGIAATREPTGDVATVGAATGGALAGGGLVGGAAVDGNTGGDIGGSASAVGSTVAVLITLALPPGRIAAA
eukprot:2609701-Prymnesium_polylepis.1